MMDHAKKDDLSKMQANFIDAICLPIYQVSNCVHDLNVQNPSWVVVWIDILEQSEEVSYIVATTHDVYIL